MENLKIQDSTLHQESQDMLRWRLSVDSAAASLSHSLIALQDTNLLVQQVLDSACELTDSPHGFVGYIDQESGHLICPTMTREIRESKQMGSMDYTFTTFHGLWGWVVQNRHSLLSNAPQQDPRSTGTPEGHLPIHRFLAVPVILGDKLLGVIALANSSRDYTERDLAAVERLAEPYAMALQRQWADREREQLQKQLRQVQKLEAIGTLAGGIAHDFNNILSAIMGYSELGLADLGPDHAARYSLEQVLKAGHRAKDLVQQILSFSRRAEEKKIPLQFSSILKETIKLLRASLPATIEIKQNIHSDMNMIMAAPAQLDQVIMNLCTNAAHSMRDTGGELRIDLQTVKVKLEDAGRVAGLVSGTYTKLTVADTGHGIDDQTMDRIFEPFFTTKGPGEGTGMGLAVTHGIVRGHGGGITVSSQPGRGTTFELYFPEMQSAAPNPQDSKRDHLQRGQEVILLVDDEESLVDVGRKMLTRLGYEVSTATDSQEALQLFKANPDRFDLLITDRTMPGMTGECLAREVLTIKPHIPVLIITGSNEDFPSETGGKAGRISHLRKPVSMQELSQSVWIILHGDDPPNSLNPLSTLTATSKCHR